MSEDFDFAFEGYDPFEYDPTEWVDDEGVDHTRNWHQIQHQSIDLSTFTNDDFIAGIFGEVSGAECPLVCVKYGNPDESGWYPRAWPCDTLNADANWYCLPALYQPDDSGAYRAQKKLAVSVHAIMLDDIGKKIDPERLLGCVPSWSIETSPGNHQYGYIFEEPITDIQVTEQLKQQLISAGLCDPGATGAAARWMRMPVAINGRPKYGNPSPRCRLTQWNPDLRYSICELYEKLSLSAIPSKPERSPKQNPKLTNESTEQSNVDGLVVISALKERGLYKRPNGPGRHDITCPWVNQHTDSVDNGTTYFEPSEQYPTGGFKCHHSHGHLFNIHQLKEFLGLFSSEPALSVCTPPQKLPPELLPVPKLDPDSLPSVIREAALDLADRLQCPVDYVVVSMLAAAGSVIGNQIGIFPRAVDETWEVYPALWGGIVGDPGSKKSPAVQQAHKPLLHLDDIAAQKHAQAMQTFQLQLEKYEDDVSAWKKGKGVSFKPSPPVEPKRQRYFAHDTTYQALGTILEANPRGVLVIGDELSGLIQSLDTAGQEAARGFYLTGWSGTGSYSFDRIGRGSVTLSRYCLSLFGGFQPDRIRGYVKFAQRGSSKNDGLLQRFQLIVWPDQLTDIKSVDRKPNKAAMDQFHQAFMRLSTQAESKLAGAVSLPSGAQLLHFSSESQPLFNDWLLANEKLLANGTLDAARQSHFAKYRSLIPALALLFHLLDGHEGPICEECLTRSIEFAHYLRDHANRVYASASGNDLRAVRLIAERLLKGELADGFTCRTLMLKGWSGLSGKEQAQAAIDALVEFGWLAETEIRSAGRPSTRYQLNPAVTAHLL
jgi:hypothetical protein